MARIAPETSLIRYSTQQRALLRALATSYVMTCFANEAAREWAHALHRRAQPDRTAATFMMWAPWSSTNRKLALVKALTAWAAEEVAAECRLRCGVAGDLLVNRYLDYQGLGHVFNDAGGNNFLILLDTARMLVATPASPVADDVASGWPDAARDAIAALRAHERQLIRSLADHVDARTASGVDSLEVWNPLLPSARDAAQAYGLNLALNAALDAADAVEGEPARTLLRDLVALFAIDRAQRQGGSLISEGVLDASRYRQLDAATDALCARLVPHVDTFVEAFGHPHPVVRSPISDPAHDYATSLARMLRVPPADAR